MRKILTIVLGAVFALAPGCSGPDKPPTYRDVDFYAQALREIKACMNLGGGCGYRTAISRRDHRDECLKSIESLTLELRDTTARLDLRCMIDGRLILYTATGDRMTKTKRITYPVVVVDEGAR